MAEPVEATPASIRLATPADAPFMVQCHIECLAETYAHLMPPEFAQARRDRFRAECDELLAELHEMIVARERGEQPPRTHWLATASDGEVVGVASSGPGVAVWERRFYDNPEPPVGWNLDHIYTRRSTHGTGLGQRLFDTALAQPDSPTGRGAWLWVLLDNPRAEAFYRRNGFVDDGLQVECGASWFHRPMKRMWRPDPPR